MEQNRRKRGRPARDISNLSPTMQAKILKHRENDRVRYYGSDRDQLKTWARVAHNNAKARARKFNVPCSVTIDDLYKLACATIICPILGCELSFQRGTAATMPNSATVDRIIPELGYVAGNVAIICSDANTAKCRLSLSALSRLGRWAETVERERCAAVLALILPHYQMA